MKYRSFKPLLIILLVFLFTEIPSAQTEQRRHSPELTKENVDLMDGNTDYHRKSWIIGNLNAIHRFARILYRRPTEKELELLAVSPEDLTRYNKLSEKGNAGIFKLVPGAGCPAPFEQADWKPECAKYSMPGSGAAYSFREETYRIERLADLTYKDDKLKAGSRFTFGILANLGEKQIDDISLTSHGVKEIGGFSIPGNLKKLKEQYKTFEKGIVVNNLFYSNIMPLEVGSLYVLRSIAHKTKSPVTIENITFDEFDFDKREEIIVVFKVLRKSDDGSITLVWKELQRKKSPKLIIEK